MITVWEIGLIAFFLGAVNAIDSPARHAFVPEMVNKDQLASAIALNSGIFNSARIIGPSIAGLLIVLTGTGGAFIINGISYIAVIAALLAMRMNLTVNPKKTHPILAIKEGFQYAFSHSIIRPLLILLGISAIFGWSYTTMMPVIAQNEFHLGAAGLGYLYAAAGAGSVVATLIIALTANKISSKVFIYGGNAVFALSLIAFSFIHSIHLALILLFFAGYGLISQFAMINTTIQEL